MIAMVTTLMLVGVMELMFVRDTDGVFAVNGSGDNVLYDYSFKCLLVTVLV